MDGALSEGELRAKLTEGDNRIVGVVVIVTGGPGGYEFYPFFRVSWVRSGHFGLVKYSGGTLRRYATGKLRRYSSFTDLLSRLELPLANAAEPDGTVRKGGFAYRGPIRIIFREDPEADRISVAVQTI